MPHLQFSHSATSKWRPILVSFALVIAFGGCSRSADLQCEKTGLKVKYICPIREGQSFWGISIGSSSTEAFDLISKSGKNSVWSLRDPNSKRYEFTPAVEGVSRKDWPTFARFSEWMLRSQGSPCVGDRYVVLSVHEDKVNHLSVFCDAVATR